MSGEAVYKLSVWRVVRSEWIKLITLRSTWGTMVALIATAVGVGVVACAAVAGSLHGTGGSGATGAFGVNGPTSTVLTGATLAVLVTAVFGVLAGAREYSSGMIKATLAAVPTRWQVLVGKTTAMVALLLVVLSAGVAGAFFAGNAVLASGHSATSHWSAPGVAGAVIGTVIYLAGVAVMGLALGMVFRSIAVGIGVVVGAVLVLPSLAESMLPQGWDVILKFLPANAGYAFSTVHPQVQVLGYWSGLGVFLGWMAVFYALAWWRLMRHDA